MRKMIIGFLLVFILLFGCLGGEEQPVEEEENETIPEEPEPQPCFNIISPEYGGEIETADGLAAVDVTLTTSDLLIKPAGGEAEQGEGHFSFILDGGEPIPVFSKTYTIYGVEEGEHLLEVELVNNDETSYSPQIIRTVSFTVVSGEHEYIPEEYEVAIKDFSYEPGSITISAGDIVTWTNEGAYPRSATCTDEFDSGILATGESFSHAFEEPGTYEYFALSHSAMQGTVVVESNQ